MIGGLDDECEIVNSSVSRDIVVVCLFKLQIPEENGNQETEDATVCFCLKPKNLMDSRNSSIAT